MYLYMLYDHRAFYVARVVFQSLKCSWQTALYTFTTMATLSTNGIFSFSSLIRIDPFLRWPALKSFSSTHRFNWEIYKGIGPRIRQSSLQFCQRHRSQTALLYMSPKKRLVNSTVSIGLLVRNQTLRTLA